MERVAERKSQRILNYLHPDLLFYFVVFSGFTFAEIATALLGSKRFILVEHSIVIKRSILMKRSILVQFQY